MDENNNEILGSEDATPTNPVEEAVVFVNTEVLSPPTTAPMTGAAKIMIDQSTGMMVQDLQSFLKGFEQVGLIALSRLANNLLTYGSPSAPHKKSKSGEEMEVQSSNQGNEMIKDLFKIVSDYAEAKTKISSMIYQNNAHSVPNEIQSSPAFTEDATETESSEKKNE